MGPESVLLVQVLNQYLQFVLKKAKKVTNL
jgi:hypothetical protein